MLDGCFPKTFLVIPGESKIKKLFIWFYGCRVSCSDIFLIADSVASACFLRKLWVWEKIHLKFVKSREMNNLLWDREKGSETVWQTVKPWELRGLHYSNIKISQSFQLHINEKQEGKYQYLSFFVFAQAQLKHIKVLCYLQSDKIWVVVLQN